MNKIYLYNILHMSDFNYIAHLANYANHQNLKIT